MYGYRPSLNLSDDENYMDIVMLITRNSMLRQGSMGCILVQPNTAQIDRVAVDVDIDNTDNTTHQNVVQDANTSDHYTNYIFNRIIAAANNTHLFSSNESDIHAEINAIGQVAKRQHYTATDNGIQSTSSTTLSATAYITMPPCKKCFAALYTCGIQRIVTRKPYHKHLIETASNVNVGIELVSLSKEQFDNQKERMNDFFLARRVNNDTNIIMSNRREILRRRKQRKDNERARKMMARERK